MSIHRRAAKRDDSEPGIIDVFLKAPASVQQLSGEGVPDLLVGFLHRNRLVEVKTGNNGLTDAQDEWHREWNGEPVYIVRNEAQANKLIRMWRAEAERTRIHFPPSDPITDQADGIRLSEEE